MIESPVAPLNHALRHAARGWPVFPLVPGTKKPLTPRGFHDGSKDPAVIRAWWEKNPDANIGICTGRLSGLVVVDVDVKNNRPGLESVKRLTGLQPTLIARTPSGGFHYFYGMNGHAPIGSRAELLPGIDLRAEGGYVVGAGSKIEGNFYEWVDPDHPVADLSRALYSALNSRAPKPVSSDPKGDQIPEGRRNTQLMSIAGVMRKRDMPSEAIEAALLVVNDKRCVPPLPADEVQAIARSVTRYPSDSDALAVLKNFPGAMVILAHHSLVSSLQAVILEAMTQDAVQAIAPLDGWREAIKGRTVLVVPPLSPAMVAGVAKRIAILTMPPGVLTVENFGEALGNSTAWDQNGDKSSEEAQVHTTVDLVTVSDVKPEQISWLWPGRIALGKLTLITGNPGLGKSLILVDLMARVSRGGTWPVDSGPCPLGDVILLSAEDDIADTIRPRLDAAKADVTRCHILRMVKVKNRDGQPAERLFDLSQDLKVLDEVIKNKPNVRAVLIDPVSSYLGDNDDNSNGEIRGLLAPLGRLAAVHKVAVILVSHNNKQAGQRAIHRAMGSVAFVAASRAAYLVVQDEGDRQRRLFLPTKNNLGPDSGGLAYRVEAPDGVPVIDWEPDPVDISADEALACDADPDMDHHDATAWLKDLVEATTEKEMAVKVIETAAKSAGFSMKTLRRVRSKAGLKVIRKGFGPGGYSVWSLA